MATADPSNEGLHDNNENGELNQKKQSFRQSFKSLPVDCQRSLLFYASDTFYYNKWIQSDFLSMLLVHGCKGDSEETIMMKAFIVTSE